MGVEKEMRILKELLEAGVDDLTSRSEQPNELPRSTIDLIKKNIRIGVKPDKETGQYVRWSSALELVHRAFRISQVARPTPDNERVWNQYEELIQFAVKELSREHGIDGSWRMTAHDLHDKT